MSYDEKIGLPEQSDLGKETTYAAAYNPDKLFPMVRSVQRAEIGIVGELPFYGFDLWNHYEVSWLNPKGKPNVAIAEIIYGCDTPYFIESKSMKLYFNSFNNHCFENADNVKKKIEEDISTRVQGEVFVALQVLPFKNQSIILSNFEGICLDELDVECEAYTIQKDYLATEAKITEEILYTNLLKSNCLVTQQPDWGSVQIAYKGRKINREGLLKYIVSYRNHNDFHEQCIERIFMDILHTCCPEELTVYGRYTRRGGLDINPYRSSRKNVQFDLANIRLCRQ